MAYLKPRMSRLIFVAWAVFTLFGVVPLVSALPRYLAVVVAMIKLGEDGKQWAGAIVTLEYLMTAIGALAAADVIGLIASAIGLWLMKKWGVVVYGLTLLVDVIRFILLSTYPSLIASLSGIPVSEQHAYIKFLVTIQLQKGLTPLTFPVVTLFGFAVYIMINITIVVIIFHMARRDQLK